MYMTEIQVKTKTEKSDEGNTLTYSYFICVNQIEIGSFFCESYGVKIVSDRDENSIIPHITTKFDRIVNIIKLLAKNTVSPCNVSDVISDLL